MESTYIVSPLGVGYLRQTVEVLDVQLLWSGPWIEAPVPMTLAQIKESCGRDGYRELEKRICEMNLSVNRQPVSMFNGAKINLAELMRISKDWQKGNMHRVYFNHLSELYGLKTEHYKSGNISGATLNGENISNGHAYRIASNLMCSKFWYDVNDGKFYMQGHTEYYEDLVAAIKDRVVIKEEE